VTKAVTTLATVILGLVVLAAASPTLIKLAGALVPIALVVGVVIALLRCVWFYTR
jgi:hypothetical protein